MEKSQVNRKWIVWGIVYAVLLFVILTVANLNTLNSWLGYLWLILRPVTIGLVLAYIINPIFRMYERKIFCRCHPPSIRRFLSLLLAYLTVIFIIVCLFGMILPQLFESLMSLFKNYDAHVSSIADFINGILSSINGFLARWTHKEITFDYINAEELLQVVTDFFSSIEMQDGSSLLDSLGSESFTGIADFISGAISVLTDSVLGIFISLYFLVSKEKRHAQIMRMRQAIFSDKVNGRISLVISTFDKSFGGFIKGKLVDALIIWALSYLLFAIFNLPFTFLLSAFIAITNIIPFIGPIIGAIPTGVIVLLTDPGKIFVFVILVIIIQQIDGNIILPKILGTNTGVSSLCVIIAISTMGALWGFVGMLLGIPLFAAILKINDYYLEKRLQEKGLPAEIENYYPFDALVDPVKDSHRTTDRSVKRLEKRILGIEERKHQDRKAKLSRSDRFYVRLYAFARKYHILSTIDDETVVQFYADKQTKSIRNAAEDNYARLRQEVEIADDSTSVSPDSNA